MVTIITVNRLGRIALMLALAMAFTMHAPIACHAVNNSCHHSSRSGAPPLPCCTTMMCLSAIDARYDAVTPAPSLANTHAPAPIVYLAPREPLAQIAFDSARTPSPPASTPLVIELRTLLI